MVTLKSYFCLFFRKSGININVNGKDCLNLATFNFLGLVGNKQVEVQI